MIKTILRILIGVIAGLFVAFGLVVAVELFGGVAHPLPEGFKETMEEMCQHVANYPPWVLAAVVPMWAFTAFISTWIAHRIGNLYAGAFLGLILLAALVSNISMLPYVTWFKIACLVAIPAAIVAGNRLAIRPRTASQASDGHGKV